MDIMLKGWCSVKDNISTVDQKRKPSSLCDHLTCVCFWQELACLAMQACVRSPWPWPGWIRGRSKSHEHPAFTIRTCRADPAQRKLNQVCCVRLIQGTDLNRVAVAQRQRSPGRGHHHYHAIWSLGDPGPTIGGLEFCATRGRNPAPRSRQARCSIQLLLHALCFPWLTTPFPPCHAIGPVVSQAIAEKRLLHELQAMGAGVL